MKSHITAFVLACCFCPALAHASGDRLAIGGQTVTPRPIPAAAPQRPNVFGTVALDAGITAYGARWRRVSAADLADPRVKQLAAVTVGLDPLAKLARVHAEVQRRIAWRSDLEGYRVSDYWAQAGETLDRGHGDGEDIAILKMQMLKAAGFSPRDIYLSVGRDSDRGADTLLLVRVQNRFYALDDRAERPIAAQDHRNFVPVITLGKDSAWLHGKRSRGARSAQRVAAARIPIAR